MVTEGPSLVQEADGVLTTNRTPLGLGVNLEPWLFMDEARLGTWERWTLDPVLLGSWDTLAPSGQVCASFGHQPGPWLTSPVCDHRMGPHSLNGENIPEIRPVMGTVWVAMPTPKHTILGVSCLDGDAGPGLSSWETPGSTGVGVPPMRCTCTVYNRMLLSVSVFTLTVFEMGGWGWECPGCPVVRTWPFYHQGPGSIPGQGTKLPQAIRCSHKKGKKKKW